VTAQEVLTAPVSAVPLDARIVDAIRAVIGDAGSVALHEPEFAGNEWAYVKDCLDSGWVSSVGAYVDRFEKALAEVTGARFAVATVNGTAALHVALVCAGVAAGDEVLLPALNFVAAANATRHAGAWPHFVEVEAATVGIDPTALDDRLRRVATREGDALVNRHTGRRIAAILCLHPFGHPARIEALIELATRHRLPLIEDAAEALGSLHRGRHLGTFGRLGILSFNGNKVVTTGGGGAILTDDEALTRRAKHLTTTARVPAGWHFVHDEVGYNYRLPNLNAALGCAQLERLDDFVARKRTLAARYAAAFASVPEVRFLAEPAGARSNYWLNTMLLAPAQAGAREAVLEAVNAAGYAARPAWTPMHHLPMYRDCPCADLAVTDDLCRRIVNLPSSPRLVDRA
jgi:perosamine synthetase